MNRIFVAAAHRRFSSVGTDTAEAQRVAGSNPVDSKKLTARLTQPVDRWSLPGDRWRSSKRSNKAAEPWGAVPMNQNNSRASRPTRPLGSRAEAKEAYIAVKPN